MAVLSTRDIAASWRQQALSTDRWKPELNQAGGPVGAPRRGEAGGMYGESDALKGRRVYMKPGIREADPRHARAAREKIASDLAHDLGIVVPPVILANRPHATDETRVCLSLVMYRSAYSWAEIVKKLDGSRPPPKDLAVRKLIDNASRALPHAAAHALSFDTWVFQMDHGPKNDHNIVFGYEAKPDGEFAYILLDYALAFGIGGRWSTAGHPEGPDNCKPAPLHPKMLENVDKAELSRMIGLIEAYPGTSIDGVVQRIPDSHLPQSEKDAICNGLKLRQGLLRAALTPYL